MDSEPWDEHAAREVAKTISDFREEVLATHANGLREEVDQVNEQQDPTRGRGRGPKWAEGV